MVMLRLFLFSFFISMLCILIILDHETKIPLEISPEEFLFFGTQCKNKR